MNGRCMRTPGWYNGDMAFIRHMPTRGVISIAYVSSGYCISASDKNVCIMNSHPAESISFFWANAQYSGHSRVLLENGTGCT